MNRTSTTCGSDHPCKGNSGILGPKVLYVVACLLAGFALPRDAGSATAPDPGALVATSAQSVVGVLLDEIPIAVRDRVALQVASRPAEFWKQRAVQQLRLTTYRLVFRERYYGGKKQLPLPPEPVWNITLQGAPQRDTNYGGHDVVKIGYSFSSTLLTDFASPEISEPHLKSVGGVWNEPFVFPIDPEMILQRTGFACMDEEDFPFNSVDSEEADSFYDQDCAVEKTLSSVGQCHLTRQPPKSCVQSIEDRVGKVKTKVRFERLAWDPLLADQVRYGRVTGHEPDLEIYLPEFLSSRITYRYIQDSSCESAEQCVGGTGWRRLLQFATSDENVGDKTLTIGGVDYTITGKHGALDSHNLFEYSACHNHYHFKYYGTLAWQGDQTINSKKAFCMKSTARAANREGSPLANSFGSCNFQGVEAGWLDQYRAGLPCQWLDITGFVPGTGVRSFLSNPLGFLCEGTFVDENGNPLGENEAVVWEPTGLIADNGEPVEKPRCALSAGWDSNNSQSVEQLIPPDGEGLITTICSRGQIGPLRNCGFRQATPAASCIPGGTVRLTCSVPAGGAPQVVRFCEYSNALGSAIPCRYEDTWVPLAPGVSDQPYTLATAVVGAAPATVTFICPSPRTSGALEPGGRYSLYTGAVFPDDPIADVTCQ